MVTLWLAAALLAQSPQAQPAPPITGTAVIRGQITDSEIGVPMPRAAVELRLLSAGQMNWLRRNLTDHEGRFEFLNLPAGSYSVTAMAGEHRATHVVKTFGGLPSGGYLSVMLKAGEVRSNVDIALSRAFAISGRVTDEFGDPMAGVDVRLAPASGAPMVSHVRQRSTDDRGMFRLFSVAPGRYVVCTEVQGASSPSTVTLTTARFVSTCYPSALNESEAQIVPVTVGDVDGIEIRMHRTRTFSISGTVVDSTGAPVESPNVIFHRFHRSGATSSHNVPAGRRFEFTDLVPGDYAVEATLGGRQPIGDTETPVRERGYVSIRLEGDSVADLVVAMKKPATVQGRVLWEDGPPPVREGNSLTIEPTRTGRSLAPSIRPVRVDDDLFTLRDLFDPVRLNVRGLPRGWVVKAIRYKGEDLTDAPAELTTDPRHQIDIVLTTRIAIVTGTVTDDSGTLAPHATVYLLPADPKRATDELYSYGSAAFSREGRFTTRGVRAGDYLIVAISSEQAQALERQRPTVEALAKHAERISLVDNDRLTMSLRVVTLPDVR
jgi:protocatechuate 3,4-dioxygenase beta subunit